MAKKTVTKPKSKASVTADLADPANLSLPSLQEAITLARRLIETIETLTNAVVALVELSKPQPPDGTGVVGGSPEQANDRPDPFDPVPQDETQS